MINDIIGVGASIAFVIMVILSSEVLKKATNWSNEGTRKFIHIGVSHWWIAAMLLIDDIRFAVLPPILFVVLNYYSYKNDLIKSMERDGGKADLGTVYFPISLLILILFTWNGGILGGDFEYLGALGILVMGYGDGFAAIVGKKMGRNKFRLISSEKSLEGSMTMFAFSFMVSFIILGYNHGFSFDMARISLIIGIFAGFIEVITPLGLDNITVPILTTLNTYLLLYNSYIIKATPLLFRIGTGLFFSFLIAYGAHRKRSLTMSGAIGAVLLGTLMYTTSGLLGAGTMIVFFISGSGLSHFKKDLKKDVAEQFDKTGNRDIFQVLANGGVGLIYSILYSITKEPLFLILLGVSFATANADTWATELGVLDDKKPISLRSLRRVNKGTSGAISLFGTIASLLGAMTIGTFISIGFYILEIGTGRFEYIQIFLIVSLGGFLGAFIDSLLGATVQGIYYSAETKEETEKKIHNGKTTKLVRGLGFFNNDIVNFLSIVLSSIMFIGI